MTRAEEILLLTVARILRARVKDAMFDPSNSNKEDYARLCEALIPFEPISPQEEIMKMMKDQK